MSAELIRQVSTESAHLAQRMAVALLAATTPAAPIEYRLASMTKAFATWPALCRSMAVLEDYAPSTSNAGRDIDDAKIECLSDFNNRRKDAA
ncbi:hypothetical protein [Caulobacter sp. UC70_42]|uniref:hypothetical protein n=1 Tax=Caulobacter sp. UC70_42 TaxID=3374551 RepID=UPI003757401E